MAVVGDPERGAWVRGWLFEVVVVCVASRTVGFGNAQVRELEHGGGEEEAEGVTVSFVGEGGGSGEREVL